MANVDTTPFNLVPQEWAFDPEIGPFIQELLDIIWQLRTRTGGDFDVVEGSQPLTYGDSSAEALGLAQRAIDGAIPIGAIVLWSGSIATIPSGWSLCDGSSGTPNLTAKFVIHADSDSGGTFDVGDTSAAAIAATNGAPSATTTVDNDGAGSTVLVASSGHGHTITITPDIPPYYALAYIQRISL